MAQVYEIGTFSRILVNSALPSSSSEKHSACFPLLQARPGLISSAALGSKHTTCHGIGPVLIHIEAGAAQLRSVSQQFKLVESAGR